MRSGVVWIALGSLCALVLACGDDAASLPPGSTTSSDSGQTSGSGAGATVGAGGASSTSSQTSGSGASSSSAGGSAPVVCPPGMEYGDPLPAQATATEVAGGYKFLEGPVWLADAGVLFFSDMNFSGSGSDGVPPSTIYRLTPPSTVDVLTTDVHSNGLALDTDGSIVACTHDQRSVSRVDPTTAARTTLAATYEGDKFNSPNDAIVRGDGTIYFTDPTWQLGNRPQEIAFKGVYRIDTGGNVHLVADDFGSPNGIALSPDETTLYVADDANGHVRSFAVAADGATSGGEIFATVGGVDGMAIDCAGNLYASSHQGIMVFDAAGKQLGTIAVGQKPSNAAFGGPDRKTLYITTSNALYSVALNVPGLP